MGKNKSFQHTFTTMCCFSVKIARIYGKWKAFFSIQEVLQLFPSPSAPLRPKVWKRTLWKEEEEKDSFEIQSHLIKSLPH